GEERLRIARGERDARQRVRRLGEGGLRLECALECPAGAGPRIQSEGALERAARDDGRRVCVVRLCQRGERETEAQLGEAVVGGEVAGPLKCRSRQLRRLTRPCQLVESE